MNVKKSEEKKEFQVGLSYSNYVGPLWIIIYEHPSIIWYNHDIPTRRQNFPEDFSLASRLELIAMRCYQWWWLGKITKDISWSRKMIVVNNNLLGVFLSSLVAEGFHFFFFPQWSNFINSTPKLFTRVINIIDINMSTVRAPL